MADDTQFGVNWTRQFKGQKINLLLKRLYCARWGCGNVPVWEHRKAVAQILWPKHKWHRWTDMRLKAFSESSWTTFLGPASSAKSTDAGMFAILYYLESPGETAIMMCSTSKEMLKMRAWNEVTKFFLSIPKEINLTDENGKIIEKLQMGDIGRLVDTQTKILWKPGDDKHGITGVAVAEGPVEQVVSNHLGVHTKRVLLVMDEMQAVRPAILKAAASNMSKNEEFKLLGIGNPDDINSLLSRESEPIAGWSSINPDVDSVWKTLGNDRHKGGLCVFTDGRKSPADDSPEERKRLPFLINSDQIANHLYKLRGNTDDPDYWAQDIGFPPPASATKSTVLSLSIIEKFDCRGRAVWTKDPTKAAALDPAFSFGGGDKKVLQFFKYGQTEVEIDGVKQLRWIVEFGRTACVPVKASNKDRPLEYQIVDFCKEECQKDGIMPENFALDSTAIGRGLKAIFEQEWGAVVGVEFGGSPSERYVNVGGRTASDQYDNRASELNISIREFAMGGQIRGLPGEAEAQFCIRRTEQVNKKQSVESKKELKKRLGRSPDEADACCISIDLAKQRGAVAELSSFQSKPAPKIESALRKSDEYYSDDNYMNNAA